MGDAFVREGRGGLGARLPACLAQHVCSKAAAAAQPAAWPASRQTRGPTSSRISSTTAALSSWLSARSSVTLRAYRWPSVSRSASYLHTPAAAAGRKVGWGPAEAGWEWWLAQQGAGASKHQRQEREAKQSNMRARSFAAHGGGRRWHPHGGKGAMPQLAKQAEVLGKLQLCPPANQQLGLLLAALQKALEAHGCRQAPSRRVPRAAAGALAPSRGSRRGARRLR